MSDDFWLAYGRRKDINHATLAILARHAASGFRPGDLQERAAAAVKEYEAVQQMLNDHVDASLAGVRHDQAA